MLYRRNVSVWNLDTEREFPERTLTVGKKPRVNTLSKLVLPQAPSPMMTSFLKSWPRQQVRIDGKRERRWPVAGCCRAKREGKKKKKKQNVRRGATQRRAEAVPFSMTSSKVTYLRMTFWALRSFAMVGKRAGERRFARQPVVVRSRKKKGQQLLTRLGDEKEQMNLLTFQGNRRWYTTVGMRAGEEWVDGRGPVT